MYVDNKPHIFHIPIWSQHFVINAISNTIANCANLITAKRTGKANSERKDGGGEKKMINRKKFKYR